MSPLAKPVRFASIYGIPRTIFKVLGRSRTPISLPFRRRRGDVAIIGCGQYAFATIGYFLWRKFGKRVGKCYDIDPLAAETFARFYSAEIALDPEAIFRDTLVKYVYIASNHASHAEYAASALGHGKVVYVEKPVAVSYQQLSQIKTAITAASTPIFFGFNRPHSAAIDVVRRAFPAESTAVTLACVVTGHVISPDHWYRRPQEGTRICGNVAHWLDLAVHILSWRHLADRWRISITSAKEQDRDDNLSIVLASERGDLVSIVMTSRSEPFEGINETICLQAGELIAKIDDFRQIKLWSGRKYIKRRFWPKDVGHRGALMQPFEGRGREWPEIEASALLVLHIKTMVESGAQQSQFSFSAARRLLAG